MGIIVCRATLIAVTSTIGSARGSRPSRPRPFLNRSSFAGFLLGTIVVLLTLTPLHAAKKLGFKLDNATRIVPKVAYCVMTPGSVW